VHPRPVKARQQWELFDGLYGAVQFRGRVLFRFPMRWLGSARMTTDALGGRCTVQLQPTILGLLAGMRGGSWRCTL